MLIIVDGNSIANRVWHTFPLTKLHGTAQPDEELFVEDNIGLFTRLFINQIISIHADLCALKGTYDTLLFICWDVKTSKNLRRSFYPEYNQNRIKAPKGTANIYPLILALRKGLREVHVRFDLTHEQYEADDLIAVFTQTLIDSVTTEEAQLNIVIVSRDSDFYQLLNQYVEMYNPYSEQLVTINDAVNQNIDHLGVPPNEYVITKAIVGDKSDNWPGIKGVGRVRVKEFLRGNLTKEHQEIIAAGERLIKLPCPDLPNEHIEVIKMFRKAVDWDTEVSWDDFIETFELSNTLLSKLNGIIV
jgi:DNA polymerase-1